MAMVNMAMTTEEAAEYAGDAPATAASIGNGPKYPWGLCIDLDDEVLAKLGITTLPPVGTVFVIEAQAKVTSMNQSEQLDGDKEGRISLQITDMAVGGVPDAKDPAEALWPSAAS